MKRTRIRMRRARQSTRRGLAATIALVTSAAVISGIVAAPAIANPVTTAVSAPSADRPPIVPLSAEQENRRAAQATQLYGSPEIRPMAERKTATIAAGDSQMSGEGAFDSSLYEAGTDVPGNYCHRSKQAVGKTIDVPADLKINIACSGAQTFQMKSTKQGGVYYFGENQGDQLEVLARNTNIKYIYVFIGANDPEGLNFGPRLTACVEARVWLRGVCWRGNTDDAKRAVGVVTNNVTDALRAVRQTMTEAGYLDSDYKFIMAGYPSPINPNWDTSHPYAGGCMIWEADAYFARNKVVPMFANAIQQAAENAGVQYLDMHTIFDGHPPCSAAPWITGLFNSSGDIFDENAWRQSFHPNSSGHVAFNKCFTQAFASDDMHQTCTVKSGDYWPSVTPGPMKYIEVKNQATGLCLGTNDNRTANSRRVESHPCLGSVVTSLVYDERDGTVHHPQSYDKCWDVWAANISPGAEMSTWDCHGGDNQQFVFAADGTIRPKTNQSLCVDASRINGDVIFGAHAILAYCDANNDRQVFVVQEPRDQQGRFRFEGTNLCVHPDGVKFEANTPLTQWECGEERQIWNWNLAGTESYISDMQGRMCLDGPPWAGGVIKIVPCYYHTGPYRQYGQFSYQTDSGYIRNRENPSLVLSSWGPGRTLTWDREGASPHQKVIFENDNQPTPGEGYSDWLPPTLNNS